MAVRLATTAEDIARCFPVMNELRPLLASAEAFVPQVQQQLAEGYELAYLEAGGSVVTVAGFRVQHILVSGLTMYVDDLVTAESARSMGHGKTMLDWLVALARSRNCATFSLDSGTQRQSAHAFYFREGMRVTSFHFSMPLK